MKYLLFIFTSLFVCQAVCGQTEVFYDDFSQNDKNWFTGKTSSKSKATIKDGHYQLSITQPGKSLSATQKIPLEELTDFDARTLFSFVSGGESQVFTFFVTGNEDGTGAYVFSISRAGTFKAYQNKGPDSEKNAEWKPHPAIKTGSGEENKVLIRVAKLDVFFYINDVEVENILLRGLAGAYTGLKAQEPGKIKIDFVRVYLTGPSYASPSKQEKKLIFEDRFEGDNKWDKLVNFGTAEVRDGHLELASGRRKKNPFRVNRWVDIDTDKDFRISLDVEVSSCSFRFYYGSNTESYRFFEVGPGGYWIGVVEKGNMTYLREGYESSYVKQNAINTIRIEKSGLKTEFYLNDAYVYYNAFTPFPGKSMGFILKNDLCSVKVHKVKVEYFQGKTKPITSDRWVMKEDFADDSQAPWTIRDNASEKSYIKDGLYHIWIKEEEDATLRGVILRDFNISRNFIIKARAKVIRGDDHSWGIAWGIGGDNDGYRISITHGDHYLVAHHQGDDLVTDVNWKESSFINNMTSYNELEIRKTGSKFYFYINGGKVDEVKIENLSGKGVALLINNDMHLAVDLFYIYYKE